MSVNRLDAIFAADDRNSLRLSLTPMRSLHNYSPLKRMPDGAWRTEVMLNHGHHHYLFVVDGKPTLDPRAQGVARNERNEKVSLLAVS